MVAFIFNRVLPRFEGTQNIVVPLAAIFLAPLETGDLSNCIEGHFALHYRSQEIEMLEYGNACILNIRGSLLLNLR